MNGVLFLAVLMERGYGVSVVVENVARALARLGVRVAVGCSRLGDGFDGLLVREVAAEAPAVARLAQELECGTVVALTSPFFELLPALAHRLPCWAWEWGDPTPAFFESDREERAEVIACKRRTVYPAVAGVLAGSEYLRSEIEWGDCPVVPAAADHAPDLGPKALDTWLRRRPGRLRVGTLMRLGYGEARYKGNRLFAELREACGAAGLACDFAATGRGTPADASELRAAGIDVALVPTENEKWAFLRGLDVFVTCSLWEGFNLPLAEAQALGTVGLAFDTGAHPEVTPFVMGSVADVVSQLRAYCRSAELLELHSWCSYRFVRGRFSWGETTRRLLEVLSA